MPTPGSSLARVQKNHLPAGAAAGDLDFGEMLRRANVLAKTALVPKSLQGNPEAIVLVGTYGAELGVPFTTSIQQIDVIENRPDPSAQLRIALIRRAGHQVKWGRTTSEEATVRARRKEYADDPDGWVEVVWTIADARRAGLVDRWVERWIKVDGRNRKEVVVVGDDRGLFTPDERVARGQARELPEWAAKALDAGELKFKDNWAKYPADMLRARAAKALSRMEFSDVLAALDVDPAFDDHDSDLDVETELVDPEVLDHAGPVDAGDDEIEDADVVDDDEELRSEAEPDPCPVPGCEIEGPYDHDSWIAKQATATAEAPPSPAPPAPPDDPKTWTGDKWRKVLADAGVKLVAALREARTIAGEAGVTLPGSIDDLEGTDVAVTLAGRLEALR